ncbi:MAG: hypothetical protein CVU65_05910 [Deltaproteobacteria bacterium HGW-Deltaproteobacteria-22]|jgi:hypothetical protein|nr:MAG: hypothetical protein CVU65_05910 [Deltaproteobacteria bacterium HGW-Deltaproteobacteria-22]
MNKKIMQIIVISMFLFIAVGCDDDANNNAANNQNSEICDNNLDDDGDSEVDCDDADCVNDDACAVNNVNNNVNNQTIVTRKVDIVFVVDTSLSMAAHQVVLQNHIPDLVQVLGDVSGGLPDLHVGVITPDLGSAPYNIPGCETPGGDFGRFLKGTDNACANPVGQGFVVDVEPAGCMIEKSIIEGEPTTCTTHDCSQANCEVAAFTDLEGIASEPAGLILGIDENGCPRCRNYAEQTLETTLTCLMDQGTNGCGFEQPLEALKLAITGGVEENLFFLRADAYLAIVFVTDEDDCSVKQAELFNPQGDINSTLGTLTSFRCTEFGVVCDQDWVRVMPEGSAQYTGCVSRPANDPRSLLFPVSSYVSILQSLKAPGMVAATVIAGPTDGSLTVGLDANQNPTLEPSCDTMEMGAMPAVRLKDFVSQLGTDAETPEWAFHPVCDSDFSPALIGLATWIRDGVERTAP